MALEALVRRDRRRRRHTRRGMPPRSPLDPASAFITASCRLDWRIGLVRNCPNPLSSARGGLDPAHEDQRKVRQRRRGTHAHCAMSNPPIPGMFKSTIATSNGFGRLDGLGEQVQRRRRRGGMGRLGAPRTQLFLQHLALRGAVIHDQHATAQKAQRRHIADGAFRVARISA